MKTLHTATPWHVGNDIQSSLEHIYANKDDGYIVATDGATDSAECRANAAHIVMCVNSHDELVAALTDLVATANMTHDGQFEIPAFGNAYALLAKVQS